MKESDVVKHFQIEGIPQSTIYCTIHFKSGLPCRKSRKGCPAKLDKKQQLNLKKNYVRMSQRRLASKLNASKMNNQGNLKKLGLKYYKQQCAPKYSGKQAEQIPSKCRKL